MNRRWIKVCRQSQVAMLRVAGLMATVATLGGKLAGIEDPLPGWDLRQPASWIWSQHLLIKPAIPPAPSNARRSSQVTTSG
jgi:hypothetical protein